MKSVRGEGRTVLFVSHNMPSVRSLCDNSILLEKGCLTGYGPTNEIIAKYFSGDQARSDNEDGSIPENMSLHNTGEGRFTFVKLKDKEGVYKKELYFKENFSVQFKFKAEKELNDVSLSVFIVNSYGENILMSNESSKYKPQNYPTGENEFEVEVNEFLMPGNYSIGLALSYYHTGSSIDHIESICEFKVFKEAKAKDFEYPWATVHGYTVPHTNWKKIK